MPQATTGTPQKLLVLGLDCVPPRLAFGRFRHLMPVLSRLCEGGTFGALRSTMPPITVPAWACMATGRDPGELGIYGFRNRVRGGYAFETTSSRLLTTKTFLDMAGEAGKEVAALFVPPNSPPRPVRGVSLACFMHDENRGPFAFPPAAAEGLQRTHGSYIPDITDFRHTDRKAAAEQLFAMGRQHFSIARQLISERQPDALMMVEIGPDRLHHLFWRCFDEDDPHHDPSSPFRDIGERYYRYLDEELGALLDSVSSDTVVMVVSDHGAQPMLGGLRLNQALLDEGLLTLKRPPEEGSALDLEQVDWGKTRAYATGGYVGRIYFNLRGRDPEGVVSPQQVPSLTAEVTRLFERFAGASGNAIDVQVVDPRTQYLACRGFPPDLLVTFGDLAYRALGTFQRDSWFSSENDLGQDGCNHHWDGIYVLAGPGTPRKGRLDASIYDVFPTAMDLLGLPKEHSGHGVSLVR